MARRRGSRGFARQVRRKFVWDRTFGNLVVSESGALGVDLLAAFRDQPGATHLGATITRIRGHILPVGAVDGPDLIGGTIGFRIDSWNEDPTDTTNAPTQQPDEDWMGWMPFVNSASAPVQASWNYQANQWAVDIKAQRKLEELNQTLWMFVERPAGNTVTYHYNLSVGLKLP